MKTINLDNNISRTLIKTKFTNPTKLRVNNPGVVYCTVASNQSINFGHFIPLDI